MHKIVSDYLKDNNYQVVSQDEERPWGRFYVFQVGDNYDKKILWVKPQNLLSLQYHGSKIQPGHSENWLALTDFRILISKQNALEYPNYEEKTLLNDLEIRDIKTGSEINIPAGHMHALVNPYLHDIFLVETRTSAKNESSKDREDNIVRVYDLTQRNNTPSYPKNLYSELMRI